MSIWDLEEERTEAVNLTLSRSLVTAMAQVIEVSTSPFTTAEWRMGPKGHTFKKFTRRLVVARSHGARASSTDTIVSEASGSTGLYSLWNALKASCSFFSKQATCSAFTATVITHLRGIALVRSAALQRHGAVASQCHA